MSPLKSTPATITRLIFPHLRQPEWLAACGMWILLRNDRPELLRFQICILRSFDKSFVLRLIMPQGIPHLEVWNRSAFHSYIFQRTVRVLWVGEFLVVHWRTSSSETARCPFSAQRSLARPNESIYIIMHGPSCLRNFSGTIAWNRTQVKWDKGKLCYRGVGGIVIIESINAMLLFCGRRRPGRHEYDLSFHLQEFRRRSTENKKAAPKFRPEGLVWTSFQRWKKKSV